MLTQWRNGLSKVKGNLASQVLQEDNSKGSHRRGKDRFHQDSK